MTETSEFGGVGCVPGLLVGRMVPQLTVLEQFAGGDIENRVGTGHICVGGVMQVVGSIFLEIVIFRKEGKAIACLRVQFCPCS